MCHVHVLYSYGGVFITSSLIIIQYSVYIIVDYWVCFLSLLYIWILLNVIMMVYQARPDIPAVGCFICVNYLWFLMTVITKVKPVHFHNFTIFVNCPVISGAASNCLRYRLQQKDFIKCSSNSLCDWWFLIPLCSSCVYFHLVSPICHWGTSLSFCRHYTTHNLCAD